jgi:hypothetical protein
MIDFAWFFIGLFFGILIGLNLGESRNRKTVEQVDADLRKEFEITKNKLVSSYEDVKWLRNRLAFLEGKKNGS